MSVNDRCYIATNNVLLRVTKMLNKIKANLSSETKIEISE